jgi:phage baseplate assembly protein W
MPFIDKLNNTYKAVSKESSDIIPLSEKVKIHSFARDISLNLEEKPDVVDVECINQSISNILLTMKTERFFNLQFGTDLYKYLFEPVRNLSALKSSIYNAINAVEKRIVFKISDVTVKPDIDNNAAEVYIKYLIKESNITGEWSSKLYV